MISIDSQYSKGSVEAARGRKMSILPAQVMRKHSFRASKLVQQAQKRCSVVGDRKNTQGLGAIIDT